MRSRAFQLSALALAGAVALLPGAEAGETGVSPVVGYHALSADAQSDTVISVPMARPAVYAGVVQAAGGQTLDVEAVKWTAHAWAYAAPAQRQSFYLDFTTGKLAGFSFRIVDNASSTLTLEMEGDDLAGIAGFGGVAVGDQFCIRPYWRVRDLFEDAQGHPLITPRPTLLQPADELLFPNYAATGVQKASSHSIYYVAQRGWQSTTQGLTEPGDAILPPHQAVILRRRHSTPWVHQVSGVVPSGPVVSFVPGGDGARANENFLTWCHPVPISLDQSGLAHVDPARSVVRASGSSTQRGDELVIIPPVAVGRPTAFGATYYYLAGAGWRQVGSDSSTVGADVILQPGTAYLVRKKAMSAGVDWIQPANF